MKLAQSVILGAWFLIGLNLMMAFGSIWVFMRMTPAIKTIERHERSLDACERMLSNLALVNLSAENIDQLQAEFSKALHYAKENITEGKETLVIESISQNYIQAFAGNRESKKRTVIAIQQLSQIHRSTMLTADRKARQFGNAGAWGIVFMASAMFTVGMLFIRGLRRNLVKSLEEIYSVIQAVKTGDKMRRCTGPDAPQDIRTIFEGLNDILDQNTSNTLTYETRGEMS